jgi:hypothetical protein
VSVGIFIGGFAVDVDLCYQSPAGPVNNFTAGNYVTMVGSGQSVGFPAAARSVAFDSTITLTVGVCVRSTLALGYNDYASFWVEESL